MVVAVNGENASAVGQGNRYFSRATSPPNARAGDGDASRTCPLAREKRNNSPPVLPPQTRSGFFGSGTTYPLSPAPTGIQSRDVICPELPRLETPAVPLSCCAP